MNKVFNLLGTLSLVLLGSCQSKTSHETDAANIFMTASREVDLGKYVDSVYVVQLENHPESDFTEIDKILISQGNIFILDKLLESVICFDQSGKFRYRIQKVGHGPGEYQELEAIWIKPEKAELWLQSFWPPKIMVYDYAGNLLREIPIKWPARDMIQCGNRLFGFNTLGSVAGKDSIGSGIFEMDEGGKLKRHLKLMGDSTLYWTLIYKRYFEDYGHEVLLLSQSDTLFRIDAHGNVTQDVVLDWGRSKYPAGLKKLRFGPRVLTEFTTGDYVYGKDQLIAFGPIRIFNTIIDRHLELAVLDKRTGKGQYSARLISNNSPIPLLYPVAKSDQNEIVGVYSRDLCRAFSESITERKAKSQNEPAYGVLDSVVTSVLREDRAAIWFARIKSEFLTY